MKYAVPAIAFLALIGASSLALADSDTGMQPNGGGQDTSRTKAVPLNSRDKDGMNSATNSDNGSQMAPNGGGQDTSRSKAVPANSQQQ